MSKVQVYWNRHKKLWSVRDAKKRVVTRHLSHLCLANPDFVVKEVGRQRSIREKTRNVHAWVSGFVESEPPIGELQGYRILYHPKENGYFFRADGSGSIAVAWWAWFDPMGQVWV